MTKLSLISLFTCAFITIVALLISNGYEEILIFAAGVVVFVVICALSALGSGRTLRWAARVESLAHNDTKSMSRNIRRDCLIGSPVSLTFLACSELSQAGAPLFTGSLVIAAVGGFVVVACDWSEIHLGC